MLNVSAIPKRYWPFIVIALAILIVALLIVTKSEQAPIELKERVWKVSAVKAELERLKPVVTLFGQVETPDMINAVAPGAANVAQVFVREGESINAGQQLLTLNPADFQPQLDQASARVSELEAQIAQDRIQYQSDIKALQKEQSLLSLRESEYQRKKTIRAQKLASASEVEAAQQQVEQQQIAVFTRQKSVDEYQQRLKQLKAKLVQAKADLQKAELAMSRSVIVTPFDGYVAKVDVSAGDQVNSYQFLLNYYPRATLEVRAKIPATIEEEVQQSIDAGHSLTASTYYLEEHVPLSLTRLSGEADPRGIDALFRFVDTDPAFRPGSQIRLQLELPAIDNVVALPYEALYGSDRIYLIHEGRLKAVEIEVMGDYRDESGDMLMLVKAKAGNKTRINPGDLIATTHLPNAITGLKVEPVLPTSESQKTNSRSQSLTNPEQLSAR